MTSAQWYWTLFTVACFAALLGAARPELRKICGLGFLGFAVFWILVAAATQLQ